MAPIAGRTVLVTGGRRGLGAALVDAALARGAARVHATARQEYADERPSVSTHVLEVGSEESVAALAAVATDVDVVINNAGVLLPAPLLTGSLVDVDRTFDVNVLGPLRMARAFAPILAARGGGALVNVHSVLSWLGGSGAYGASKAAAWSMTNSLRIELAAQGTQVVGVHAGFIDTDMVAAIDTPKVTPAEVASRVLDGLESGAGEVLADDVTRNVKELLAGPVEKLTLELVR
ncbi:putative short chain dehydrogenase/reductase [Streptomyces sulfonofaciens]|uniref:Short chain dehydrogenase/reductase n=1 Tax=Streptomyces sulfonofaciens TaxID=68272 RepID=A0A919L6J1_9ACTN|nr:SDR family oxidoreductase [Streptomyces sulfonofaciens]GHH85768.1 putative short chain dehydrogenase/reductase [Streptomyces sulfonofaciens]